MPNGVTRGKKFITEDHIKKSIKKDLMTSDYHEERTIISKKTIHGQYSCRDSLLRVMGLWCLKNMAAMSWRSALFVGDTGENHRPVPSHRQTLSQNVVLSTPRMIVIRTHNVSGDKNLLHRYI